jgi:hypothetical protein
MVSRLLGTPPAAAAKVPDNVPWWPPGAVGTRGEGEALGGKGVAWH